MSRLLRFLLALALILPIAVDAASAKAPKRHVVVRGGGGDPTSLATSSSQSSGGQGSNSGKIVFDQGATITVHTSPGPDCTHCPQPANQ